MLCCLFLSPAEKEKPFLAVERQEGPLGINQPLQADGPAEHRNLIVPYHLSDRNCFYTFMISRAP